MSAIPTEVGILIPKEAKRDAIHIAIAPVIASETLTAGQPIGFLYEGDCINVCYKNNDPVGIVDPFLRQELKKGDRFWMFLNPNTITSLRHEWTHPLFKETSKEDLIEKSEAWIEDFAEEAGLTSNELLEAAENYIKFGEYLNEGPRFEGFYIPDEFWDHYEVITGDKISKRKRGSFFSCSC